MKTIQRQKNLVLGVKDKNNQSFAAKVYSYRRIDNKNRDIENLIVYKIIRVKWF